MNSCFRRLFGVLADLVIIAALCCAFTMAADAGALPGAPELLRRLRDAGLPDVSDADLVSFRPYPHGSRQEDELSWPRSVPRATWGFAGKDGRQVFVLQHRVNGRSRFFDPNTLATFTVRHGSDELKEEGRDQVSDTRSLAEDGLMPASLRLTCQRTEDLLYNDWIKSIKGKAQLCDRSFTKATNAILLAVMMEQQVPSSDVAQRLVRFAAARVEDPEALISAAVNRIADGQYLTLALRFGQTRDKQAFAQGLEELLASWGDEWLAARAMRMLLNEFQSHKAPPPLPPSGEFTPEQRRTAEAFLRNSNFDLGLRRSSASWLLSPPDYLLHRPPSDAVLRLLALRNDAIPILQAWEKDDTLTAFFDHSGWQWAEEEGENEQSPLERPHGRQDEEARKLERRKQRHMRRPPRPQPRSRIARDLLRDLLPSNVYSHEFTDEQREMYFTKLKRMSPRELAWHYLRNGHDAKAVYFLATQAEENDLQRLERGILETNPSASYWRKFLLAYVAARGEEASGFLEQLKLRVQDNDEGVALIERLLESTQEQKPEEQKPDGQPPGPLKEAIERYQAAKPETEKKKRFMRSMELHQRVLLVNSMTDRLKALEMLVGAARQSEDSGRSSSLLSEMRMLPFLTQFHPSKENPHSSITNNGFITWEDFLDGQEPPGIFAPFCETQNFMPADPQWDYVRAREAVRELSGAWLSWLMPINSAEGPPNSSERRKKSVVDLIIGLTHHPYTANQIGKADEHLIGRLKGDNAGPWRTEEVIRLLKGEIDHLPILPATNSVAVERLKEIQQAVKTLPTRKITEYLDELSIEELLALFENRTEDNDMAVANRLRDSYQRIAEAHCKIDSDRLRTLGKRLTDRAASLDMIQAVGKALQTEAENDNRSLVATLDFHLRGTVLTIKDVGKRQYPPFKEYSGVMIRFELGYTYPQTTNASGIWLKEAPSPDTQLHRAVLNTSKKRIRRDLVKKLERFLDASFFDERFPFLPAQVTIVARP